MASVTSGPPRPRGGSKLTIGLGLVNVEVKIDSMVPTASGRTSSTTCCAEHKAPVVSGSSTSKCSVGGETLEPADRVMLYEKNGSYVEVDTEKLGLDKSSRLDVQAAPEESKIDPLYFERPYAVWPEEGYEAHYDLLCEWLRRSEKVFVGTTVMRGATKVMVLRWSKLTQTLIAEACTYDARIKWEAPELAAAGIEARPKPSAEMLAQVDLIVGQLADEFDTSSVTDEYAAALDEAIERAAAGMPPVVRPDEPVAAPMGDLMTALKASVDAVVPKKKPAAKKKPAKKKVAA